jgi:hypothetical protein
MVEGKNATESFGKESNWRKSTFRQPGINNGTDTFELM